MELILQKNLPHQQRAVDAINKVFDGVEITKPRQFFENPIINLSDPNITQNINELQKSLPSEYRSSSPAEDVLNLDIKMETGTGKTYVYTKTIYELHKNYGFNKFIIAVPSLAIKAGTGQFLKDAYAKKHFTDVCGYGTEIEVGILESHKKKKGRFFFPSVVSDFVKGSTQNSKKIYVLLVNMQLLAVRKNGMLSRDDYDSGVEGFFRPFDALGATKPIVIIDEPHRFSRDQKAFKVILDELKPQSIIRFGATFPETSTGRGKNRITVKDYQNLLYDLNACESFNQNLIKGVAKEHFEPISKRQEKVRITSINSRSSVNFQHKKQDERTKTYTLQKDDSLSIISEAFEGITISGISASEVIFSNGITKSTGEELDVDIYMTSYQEQMMRLALERHFEIEKSNFCGRNFKIKTLALFFIDDIASYRETEDGKEPYLLKSFERLLKERIEIEISNLSGQEEEYKKYLEESLANISACHGGYFAQDNSDSDEDIAKEVDAILNGKKQLLSFKKPDGSYNTIRFLFSKWTLKEGWDNPNVFTIAKLRSSGSENSKLQEVGRGLRLPVDENGNRISNEEFQLNYIVDFTEADFAQRLIDQINGELPQASPLTKERIEEVAAKLGMTSEELFRDLYIKQYIDWERNIKTDARDAFFAEYPDFAVGLDSGKVKDRNRDRAKPVKIRKAAYNDIKELWERINQRYLLFYDKDLDVNMEDVVLSILEAENVFTDVTMTSSREIVKSDGSEMSILSESGVQYIISKIIPYNEFLKRIMQGTNIAITTLHQAVSRYTNKNGMIKPEHFNENTVSIIIQKFQEWKNENLQGRFHYAKSSTPVGSTALSFEDGSPRREITQGRIGTKLVEGTPSDKYLYDSYAYDSPLEKNNIMADIEKVVVYGKIPRSSIAIPTITGGMYSPDFMYIVKKRNGEKELNIVVETKDVENKNSLRGTEKANLECAKVFFDILSKNGYKIYFRDQLNNRQMAQVINEVLGE
ncbi:type III restriction-modification system endonuclease [Irregularibacter muris]|uniref:Type III restriction-modification system endonuclease n=1 Tax=Irregularibacter muris TaxID=1796619 RepID=A0AAE3HFU5_9FIRM|nr:type III restriction-modification system endonuclease [Irregularibacter muris]MCR1899381.1 type III restriction-modification system endonuclease [Irregularibacter muris]